MEENNQQQPQVQYVVQGQPQPMPVINIVNTNTNTNNNNGYEDGAVRKSKWVAFFLCFFLGYLGVHNFYVGKTGMGILYLLTVGLFGIGWLVDCVRILFGGFPDKWGRRLV